MLFTWVTRGTGVSSSTVSSSSALASSLCFFNFFGFVISVTTTPDKFQFPSQVRLFQINVIVLICLKFKLYAVFIDWNSRLDFLLIGRQQIVNYWYFPYKISRDCHWRLVPKITWHDYWGTVVKKSLRDRVICFADFIGMTLLACLAYASSLLPMAPFLFLLPLLSCFLRVCLPTPFAAVLKLFLPLTTSAISGTANSDNSASSPSAARMIYSRKNGIAVLPITCAGAPKPRTRCRPTPLWNGISTCVEATIL